MLFGSHMSIAGGLYKAIYSGAEAGCDVVQIFTKSSNQWKAKELLPSDIDKFLRAQEATKVRCVAAHTSYLINCASPNDLLFKKSVDALIIELSRAEALQIPYLVLHPGAHVGSGLEAGIARIVDALHIALEETKGYKVKIALETTAGQGSSIGSKFEHLGSIIRKMKNKKRICICLDTCHSFAAGYNLSDRKLYKKIFADFDDLVGIQYISLFHFNDSKKELNSNVDRHAHIGEGEIGLNGFEFLVNDKRFKDLPVILETPKGPELEEDRINLKKLKSLIKK